MELTTVPDWKPLGSTPPAELAAARLELHHAAQIPAALGIARGRPEPDYGHHSLAFDSRHGALASVLVPGSTPHRAAVRLGDLALLLLDAAGDALGSFPLAGHTVVDGLRWLADATAALADGPGPPLALPDHEMPEAAFAADGRFGRSEPSHAEEVARWYADFARVLGSLREGEEASPVRVWSHHFDMDTVLRVGEKGTIGLGLSPGDEFYAEPYLYALPYPLADEDETPPIEPPGVWRSEGFTGAVLRGSAVAAEPPGSQAELALRFYRSAVRVLRPRIAR